MGEGLLFPPIPYHYIARADALADVHLGVGGSGVLDGLDVLHVVLLQHGIAEAPTDDGVVVDEELPRCPMHFVPNDLARAVVGGVGLADGMEAFL